MGGRPSCSQSPQAAGCSIGVTGSMAGQKKEESLGSWMGAWAGVAETSIPHCKVAPGWHPAVVRHGVHGAPRQGLAWHSWCGSSGSSPVPCKSHHSCCPVEMCFAGMCSMWSCTGVVLHGGRCVCMCPLLSALVRHLQSGLSAVMTPQPDPRCRSLARQGDLLYPAESLGRCPKVWDSHLCRWPFAAMEPALGSQLCERAGGCILAGAVSQLGGVWLVGPWRGDAKQHWGPWSLCRYQGISRERR